MGLPVHKIPSSVTFCVVLFEPQFSYMYAYTEVLLNFWW